MHFKISSILAAVALVLGAQAQAGTNQSLPMGAGVASSISLAMDIFETSTISEQTKVTSGVMDFGDLVLDVNSQTYRGGTWFTVVFWPSSNEGRQWTLKMTASSMTNSSNGATLPDGAFIYTPWPVDHNGQNFPDGSAPSARGSVVGTNKTIFTSNSTGDYTSVPVTFAITNDPNLGATDYILADQQSGSYSTTVTIDMVSNA